MTKPRDRSQSAYRRAARADQLAQERLYEQQRRAVGGQPRAVWQFGLSCHICGCPIHSWQFFNLDHVLPRSRGGINRRKNRRLTHVICNKVKSNTVGFRLRTAAEREAARPRITPEDWRRLEKVWAGEPG